MIEIFNFFFGWLCAMIVVGIPAGIIADGLGGAMKDIKRNRNKRW